MITSTGNERIRQVIRLNTKAKARRESGCFVAEGLRIFREIPDALRRAVFLSESFAAVHPEVLEEGLAGRRMGGIQADGSAPEFPVVELVSDPVFQKMSDTKSPQGILSVVQMPQWSRVSLLGSGDAPLILVLETLQDPGNVGTMIRTAEGAGITGIIVSRDTADVFSPKVIRATMGSVFRVPVCVEDNLQDAVAWLHKQGVQTFASHLEGSVPYTSPDYTNGTAFLIGNEGNGLSPELTALAGSRIRIPMEGAVESLNASVAAALMMYEAHRQRTTV